MNNEVRSNWDALQFLANAIDGGSGTNSPQGIDGQVWPAYHYWPDMLTRDHAVAVVLNEADEALILANKNEDNGWSSWHLLDGMLQMDEDPLSAIQRQLRESVGYESSEWVYLGTFVIDDDNHMGVNHFFLARQARPSRESAVPDDSTVQWVPLPNLRTAMLDGRIAVIKHAMTIALALLTVLR